MKTLAAVAFALAPALTLSGCVVIDDRAPIGKSSGGSSLVCHKGKKTMDLPDSAVEAHLNHGDRLGPC